MHRANWCLRTSNPRRSRRRPDFIRVSCGPATHETRISSASGFVVLLVLFDDARCAAAAFARA